MAIGTPVERYQANLAAQGGTTAFHPASNIAAGTTAFVITGGPTTFSKVISSVSDDAGNTWTVDASQTSGGDTVSVASCQVTNQIATTNTITITWSVSNSANRQIWVQEVSGLATSPLDKSVGANGSTTAVSSGNTAALSQADELVWGICRFNSATWTKGTGYSNVTSPVISSGTALEYKIVSSTSAIAATGTLSAAVAWVALAVTYKASIVPATITPSTSSSASAASAAVSAATAIAPSSSSSASSSSGAVTASPHLSMAASSASVSSATVTAATQIPVDAASSSSLDSVAVTAKTQIPVDAASSISSSSVAMSAATQIPLNIASSSSSNSIAVAAPTQIPLNTASSASSNSLGITTSTQIPISPTSSSSLGAATIDAATQVPLAFSSSTSLSFMALTSATQITPSSTSSTSLASGTISVDRSDAVVGLNLAVSTTTNSLALSTPVFLSLGSASSISSSIMKMMWPDYPGSTVTTNPGYVTNVPSPGYTAPGQPGSSTEQAPGSISPSQPGYIA